MKNMSLKKGLRTTVAMVLAVQLAFGSVVSVLAEEGKTESVQVEQDVYTPSKLILDSSWEVESGNENLVANADGSITITTQEGTIGDEKGMNNIVYHKLNNSTDYEFTVKVEGEFVNDYQSAYLMITSGKNLENVVGVTHRHHSFLSNGYGTNMLMGMQQVGDEAEFYTGAKEIGNSFYLKLKKNNSNITGYFAKEYSTNEADWTKIVDTTKNINQISKAELVDTDEVYIALAASNGGGNKSTNITFSDVKVNGNQVPLVTDMNGYYSLEVSGEKDAHMDLNKTMKLSLNGFNQDKSIAFAKFDKVVYTSSNERVAKVDAGGVVTASGVGTTVITAEATIGKVTKTATYQLQVGEVATENTWQVQSPNGNMTMDVILMNDGTLRYTAMRGNEVVIPESPAGIVTNLGDFTGNLVFKGVSEAKEIDESYQMITGKGEKYKNHCYEKVVTFTLANDASTEFDIIMRAYDDGTAFRYRVRTKEEKELRISKEITGLRLDDKTEFYYMNYNSATWNYEGEYVKDKIETIATGATPSMPFLYQSGKNNIWTLYTEADLHGTYCGSMFEVEKDGLLRVKFAKAQQSDVVTKTPFESPWRLAITGTPEHIVENTLVENLNPAADEETYKFSEWVDPGLSSWSWVANWGNGISDQTKKETHMHWIDLAAEMGWEYYILDEGWQPRVHGGRNWYEGYRDWFYEVRDYAKEKGVKLCAWVRVNDIRNAEDRRARFEQWSKDGIVAIKADFFDSEGQETIQLYDDLYKDAAKYRLMVNCHGANKPTGEIRTYPNVFAREAIRGQEAGGITAHQYTLIPFIRAAIGPADVTEELRSKDYNKTTMGFQIALTALFEDGIHSMGSAPDVYKSNEVALEYYKNYPDHWDETEYLNGEIGTYLNMARRHEEDWYVSGISVDNRIMRIPLNFLEENMQYTAMIYQEDGRFTIKNTTDLEKMVTSEDTLEIPVLKGGGYAVRLVSKGMVPAEITAPEVMDIEEGYETDIEITVKKGGMKSKEVIWSSADESIATVTSTGKLRGIKAGTTTVTVAFAEDKTVKKEIKVTVASVPHVVDGSNWKIYKKNSDIRVNEDNSITIITKTGVMGDNPSTHHNLFGMDVPEGTKDFEIKAKISGGLKDDYQGGFIVAFDGDNPNENYVAAGRRHHSYLMGEHPPVFGMMAKEEVVTEFYCNDEQADDDVYIKLVKKGSEFSGYYSYDGKSWSSITNKGVATSMIQGNLAECENLCVGFYAGSGGGNISTEVTFSEFTYNGQEIPVAFAIYELCEQLKEAETKAAELAAKLEAAQKAEEEARQKAEAAEKVKAEAEKKAKEAETARAEAEKKAEAAEQAKAEAEKKAEAADTAKTEAMQKAEAAKAEAEKKAEAAEKAQAEAALKADTSEKLKAEAEKKAEAAEQAKAEAEKKAEAAEQAKIKAEQEAEAARQAKAEAEQKAEAAKQAQEEAEQKAEAAEQAKIEAEQAKVEAEKNKTELEQKVEAAEQAKTEAEQKAETAEQEKTEAEQGQAIAEKAQKEAEAKEAVQKAKAEAAEKAKLEAEEEDTEEDDICISGSLIYRITDTTEFTVSVCGTIKPNLAKITIPATITLDNQKYKVTEIEPNAFAENKSLKKVVIGANIEKIGKKAFYKAKKLKTIQIASNVLDNVGKDAFKKLHKKATIKATKNRVNKYKKLIKDVRFGVTKR